MGQPLGADSLPGATFVRSRGAYVNVTPSPRFDLRRYFSIASLIALLVATLVVGGSSYLRAREALLKSSEDYTASIARNLSDQIANDAALRFNTNAQTITLDAPHTPQLLAEALPARLYGLNLHKFKVFDLGGRVAYSTMAQDIGRVEGQNAGLASAHKGLVFSEYGDGPGDEDEARPSGSFIETYAPLYARAEGAIPPAVVGVVEIYRDVTQLESDLTRSELTAAGVTAAVMLLLYIALLLIVGRANRILSEQRSALEEKNRQLEQL
jgi:hypothetical protein